MNSSLLIRFGCLLILAALPLGCQRQSQARRTAKGIAAVPVTVRPVRLEKVQRQIRVVGTLWAEEDATLSSKIGGRVALIYKDVGDRVPPGEPLAQVAPVDFELAQRQKELASREPLAKLGLSELPGPDFDPATVPTVHRAKLQADNAEARYLRGKQLHDQRPPLLSDQDYADLKTAWEVAQSNHQVELLTAQSLLAQARSLQADLAIAGQRLADTTIRAPATQPAEMDDGHHYTIAARMTSVGEYVKEGTPVYRVVDDDPLKLRANVPERYARDVALGQEVRVNVEAFAEDFVGRIARINPQVDPANRTFQVEAIVPNERHLLKPGSFAQGRVLIRLDENVVFVPQESVVTFAGTSKVFTVAGGKAVENIVELGARLGDYVEAVGAIKAGDSVVVEGATKLASGVAVEEREAAQVRSAPATRPADVAAAPEVKP